MEIRWACPSENPPPLSPTLEFMPFGSFFTKSYAQAVFKASIISSSVAFGFTMRILSAIVPEKIVFPCGTYAKNLLVPAEILQLTPLISLILALPDLVLIRPNNNLIIVVLPSPEGPTRATISPGFATISACLNTVLFSL